MIPAPIWFTSWSWTSIETRARYKDYSWSWQLHDVVDLHGVTQIRIGLPVHFQLSEEFYGKRRLAGKPIAQ